jgi:hypothetical protein
MQTTEQQTWTHTHTQNTKPEHTRGNKTTHDVLETGSVSVLGWKHVRGTYSVISTQDRVESTGDTGKNCNNISEKPILLGFLVVYILFIYLFIYYYFFLTPDDGQSPKIHFD